MKAITPEGYKQVNKQIEHINKVERPQIIKDIQVARAFGDLKENAEYHAAKEKQGFIESRYQKLLDVIKNSQIIDNSKLKTDQVFFGAEVTYKNVDTEEEFCWKLVGGEEINIEEKKISVLSPIGRTLLGKQLGDTIIIEIPQGKIEVEIIKVCYY